MTVVSAPRANLALNDLADGAEALCRNLDLVAARVERTRTESAGRVAGKSDSLIRPRVDDHHFGSIDDCATRIGHSAHDASSTKRGLGQHKSGRQHQQHGNQRQEAKSSVQAGGKTEIRHRPPSFFRNFSHESVTASWSLSEIFGSIP